MVKAKKHLGQHFLKDESIALRIVESLEGINSNESILEIGPGTGVLTKYLKDEYEDQLTVIDLDEESIGFLKKNFAQVKFQIIHGDFLKLPIDYIESSEFHIIGNLPYNISSQIFFKILEEKHRVQSVVCMLQYEVAKRLASPPGNKDYGILSVLLQAYYKLEYLFDVEPHVFEPPPKVRSGVIRLTRNSIAALECNEALFKSIVKQGFQNRRKTLRNALKPLNLPIQVNNFDLLNRRAETLSVNDFVGLTQQVEKWSN